MVTGGLKSTDEKRLSSASDEGLEIKKGISSCCFLNSSEQEMSPPRLF